MQKNSLLIICALFISILSNAQTISEWREEGRTGVSAETGLLKVWPAEGPELLWTNSGLPKGHSSVTFGNNLAYVTGLEGEYDVVVAIDDKGAIRWKRPYGRCWSGSYSDSRCTPTVEGDRVYVSGGLGDIACIDGNSGVIVWTYKAGEIHKGISGTWGMAESLLIDGDKLYFTPGGPETMTIALNKNDGKLIWKTESLNDGAAYVSPLLIDHEGNKLLVNISSSYVYSVDVMDGTIPWKIDHLKIHGHRTTGGDRPATKCITPVYHQGKIYVTAGYNAGGIMINLEEKGKLASVAWTDTVMDAHHGGVVLIDGYLYGSNWIHNSDGNWCCMDWETGTIMYEEHWNCKGSIIAAEGLLYVCDEKRGNVGLVRATPEKFDLISTFRITQGTGPFWAHPSIHGGILFIRHGNALMAYNIRK